MGVSSILASATNLPVDASNIPITALPTEIQASVSTSLGPLPTGVPVGQLPSSIVSQVLATATNLPADASNIPISALPTDIVASLTSAVGGLPTAIPVGR